MCILFDHPIGGSVINLLVVEALFKQCVSSLKLFFLHDVPRVWSIPNVVSTANPDHVQLDSDGYRWIFLSKVAERKHACKQLFWRSGDHHPWNGMVSRNKTLHKTDWPVWFAHEGCQRIDKSLKTLSSVFCAYWWKLISVRNTYRIVTFVQSSRTVTYSNSLASPRLRPCILNC